MADELAPLFDSETALPVELASPVGPELPVFPVLVWTTVFVVAAGFAACDDEGAVVVVVCAPAAGPTAQNATRPRPAS